MTTIWKSDENKSTNEKLTKQKPNNENGTFSGTTLSSWSRQQKLATIAGFAILGMLLAASACSKQSERPALVGVSSPQSASATAPATANLVTTATAPVSTAPAKKAAKKKRPANVTYTDANSGVSFLYPRKFLVTSAGQTQPEPASGGNPRMNFVQPGGVAVATVAAPAELYPGSDFAAAFFAVNVNRSVSEQECAHFAFVDTSNADGEPVDAEKVKVGSTEMEMTSGFSASAIKQDETQYYHSYKNGACYEYVLGLGTEGYGTEADIKHVDRDEVFSRLEKILATVKVTAKTTPVEPEHVAEQSNASINGGKE